MGGPNYSEDGLDAAVAKAKALTEAQLEAAQELHIEHFDNVVNPEAFAAIIQAMASNYALIASKK